MALPKNLTRTEGNPVYTSVVTGEVLGTVSAAQLPTVACSLVRIKANTTNVGAVYLGSSAAVTVKAGATNTTTGLQMNAGDDTGWMTASNLNLFWIINANASDGVTYMAF